MCEEGGREVPSWSGLPVWSRPPPLPSVTLSVFDPFLLGPNRGSKTSVVRSFLPFPRPDSDPDPNGPLLSSAPSPSSEKRSSTSLR